MKRGSSQWRYYYWGRACQADLKTFEFYPGKRITVDARTIAAFTALGKVLQTYSYKVRDEDTGAYNCRKMKGSSAWSSHAWGTAVDINWKTNPYTTKLVTDMPKEMVDAILAIKTVRGQQVFRWGGDWDNRPDTEHNYYDAMHFEIYATPGELAKGISWKTVEQRDDMASEFRVGQKGSAVALWQKRLNQAGFAPKDKEGVVRNLKLDGSYGKRTRTAVENAQKHFGLDVNGVLDVTTMIQVQSYAHGKLTHAKA